MNCYLSRQYVLNQVLYARTLTEITVSEHFLREWLQQNPNDTGMREAFEGLSLMRDIAEEQEVERLLFQQEAQVA